MDGRKTYTFTSSVCVMVGGSVAKLRDMNFVRPTSFDFLNNFFFKL